MILTLKNNEFTLPNGEALNREVAGNLGVKIGHVHAEWQNQYAYKRYNPLIEVADPHKDLAGALVSYKRQWKYGCRIDDGEYEVPYGLLNEDGTPTWT